MNVCEIVDPIGPVDPARGRHCAAPPGLVNHDAPVRDCYQCGLPVCRSCSAITTYRGKRVRRCAHCLEEARLDAARRDPGGAVVTNAVRGWYTGDDT